MKKVGFALLLFGLACGAVVPAAAAEQLHANVVAWSPNDVQPGEPVSVILQLYTAGASPYPKDGHPVADVNDAEVVIRGEGQTHRFATEDLGGGRYSTEIIFPKAGGWHLRVRYGVGSYGPGDEILLGKGAICVGGEFCVDEQPAQSVPARRNGRAWTALALAVVVVLIVPLGAAVIRFGALGRRRRFPRPA